MRLAVAFSCIPVKTGISEVVPKNPTLEGSNEIRQHSLSKVLLIYPH